MGSSRRRLFLILTLIYLLSALHPSWDKGVAAQDDAGGDAGGGDAPAAADGGGGGNQGDCPKLPASIPYCPQVTTGRQRMAAQMETLNRMGLLVSKGTAQSF